MFYPHLCLCPLLFSEQTVKISLHSSNYVNGFYNPDRMFSAKYELKFSIQFKANLRLSKVKLHI